MNKIGKIAAAGAAVEPSRSIPFLNNLTAGKQARSMLEDKFGLPTML